MNREIKFRGKRIDTGEWVYGDLLQDSGLCFIVKNIEALTENPFNESLVNPDTVGQYTELKDKNGREIYEGDIIDINYKYDACGINGVIPDQDCDCRGVVLYNQYTVSYELRLIRAEYPIDVKGYNEEFSMNLYSFDLQGYIDLCGNIFDNKDLYIGRNC